MQLTILTKKRPQFRLAIMRHKIPPQNLHQQLPLNPLHLLKHHQDIQTLPNPLLLQPMLINPHRATDNDIA